MNARLSSLFEKVTVMHSTERWSNVHRDLVEVLGPATFTDNVGWASFGPISLSDESAPPWSILAKTTDLAKVARVAEGSGWTVSIPMSGAHEKRLVLRSPSGLTVVAYTPDERI